MKKLMFVLLLMSCSVCLADGASPRRQSAERARVNGLMDRQAAGQAAHRDAIRKKAEAARVEAEAKLSPEEKTKLRAERDAAAKRAAIKARALRIKSQSHR